MDFVARHSPTRIGAGAKTEARISQAEELIQIPWLIQLGLEGRIFVAGHGIEEAGINSESALDDQTPSVALVAPVSGTIVLPLYFRAYFDTEGGGIPAMLMTYCQLDKFGSSSSSDFTIINCLGGTSPRKPQASCVHTVSSVTGITNAENVVLHERTHMLDNMVTVEAPTTIQGVEPFSRSLFEFIWKPKIPIALKTGSAVIFYAHTGTTDSAYNYTIAWAELDEDTYEV